MRNAIILCTLCLAVILTNVFYFFPTLGHDFFLFLSWASDYHVAWNEFGVFNVQFSPQRCGGIPVWANPLGANFSIFHILSLFLPNLGVLVAMLSIFTIAGFWGTWKFLGQFNVPEHWRNYLTTGWCLQGFILCHTMVGHVAFMTMILWPFYCYLLLKPQANIKSRAISIFFFSLLISHDYHLSLVYHYVMFPVSFLLLLGFMKLNEDERNLRGALVNLCAGMFLSALIILPKTLATLSFVKNFQRSVSFVDIGISKALEYSILSQFFPIPLDYQKMTGWWYGNWESTVYLFPGLLLVMLIMSLLRFQQHKKTALSILLILLLGVFISSGIYDKLASNLPLIKSFHVNPRWMLVLNLSILFSALTFLKKHTLREIYIIPLILFNLAIFWYALDKEDMHLNYTYQKGYDPQTNRLSACYEPVFGYSLELFPHDKVDPKKWVDPRCYLTNDCKSYVLPDVKVKDLLEYKLQPF
jgi:hypothetical protein